MVYQVRFDPVTSQKRNIGYNCNITTSLQLPYRLRVRNTAIISNLIFVIGK
jgi:hypothetical protein